MYYESTDPRCLNGDIWRLIWKHVKIAKKEEREAKFAFITVLLQQKLDITQLDKDWTDILMLKNVHIKTKWAILAVNQEKMQLFEETYPSTTRAYYSTSYN